MTESIAGDSLRALIQNRQALIGVVGLGYVGLPLIDAFANEGFRCIGFDIDPEKVSSLLAGRSYIGHIDDKTIAALLSTDRFTATTDLERLKEPDAILICVPTPLSASRDPDLQFVTQTSRSISTYLRSGQLVILESTTYPGTTRGVVLPILESSGLKVGRDFFLAYSPEREDPGNPKYSARSIPKVVGAMDLLSRELAESLYGAVVKRVISVSTCEVAEACKILENTYRSVNIAMVNELKMLFDAIGIDIWEVIDAASTKPFGFQAFYPGPGLGGHCIPIDPFYLSWLARHHGIPTRFIELAGEINTGMPRYVIRRVVNALNDSGKALRGSRILVLGVAYKKDVDDARESPAFEIIHSFVEAGVNVTYNDPHIPSLPRVRSYSLPALQSVALTEDLLARQDCVLIVTDHSSYDYEFIVKHSKLTVDTRGATRRIVGTDELSVRRA